jgi:hypothetical protein
MGIREDLDRDKSDFVSLRATIGGLSEGNGVTISEAALWFRRRIARATEAPAWRMFHPEWGAIRDDNTDKLGPDLLARVARSGRFIPSGAVDCAGPDDLIGFDAEELRRFLDGVRETSNLTLDTAEVQAAEIEARAWPWGTHETELLRHLAAAGGRFWVNFDPSDPTTAPTNEDVSTWLTARGVSKRMADAMASILRADGLATGPRGSS